LSFLEWKLCCANFDICFDCDLGQILDDYLLKFPWNMFVITFICCWMFGCIAGVHWDEFWVKIENSASQTRRNSLLAKISLIANFLRQAMKKVAPGSLIAHPSGLGSLLLGLSALCGVGDAFQSLPFIVLLLYNIKTTSRQRI
jgi:hypothetical protein